MSKLDVVTEIHKNARVNFLRRRVIMKDIDDTWQADLIDMLAISNVNSGNKYILVVIDTFSKFAWAYALKQKNQETVASAFQNLLKQGRIPKNLQTDLGTEFYNIKFNNLMKTYKINHYSTYTTKKAAIAERFIRTLKSKLYKQFSLKGNYRWYDGTLEDVLNDYNNSYHRTIACSPANVNKHNKNIILRRYEKACKSSLSNTHKYKVNEFVRISKHKGIFEKGYTPNWSTEIFRIKKVQNTSPVTYLLEDSRKQPILGAFYKEELQLTKNPHLYLVEKVLKTKGNKVLVKWLGLSMKENSWIDKSDCIL